MASMSELNTACKKTSLTISKLKGVKTIRIIKKLKSPTEIFDGSNELTKADAVKALEKAKHYKIPTWSKA